MCRKCEDIQGYNFAEDRSLAYYKSKKYPDGKFCILVYGTYEGEETGEMFEIDVEYCPWCGRELDLEEIW